MRIRIFKIALVSLILIVSGYCSHAQGQQKINKEEWEKLIRSLEEENWKSAETLSQSYIDRYKSEHDTTGIVASMRYMYMRSVAARLASKQYTKEQALAKVKQLTGEEILTPTLQFKAKGMFNFVKVSDDSMSLFICAANDKGTEIHTFELYEPQDTVIMSHVAELEDKHVRLYAKIADIKTGGMSFPHLEVRLVGAEVYVDEH